MAGGPSFGRRADGGIGMQTRTQRKPSEFKAGMGHLPSAATGHARSSKLGLAHAGLSPKMVSHDRWHGRLSRGTLRRDGSDEKRQEQHEPMHEPPRRGRR